MNIEEITPAKPQGENLPTPDTLYSELVESNKAGIPLWDKFLRHSSFSVPIFIFLAGFVVYFNSIQNPMILDDHSNIIQNPSIREIGLPQPLPIYLKIGISGRPFTHFTFSLNYAISGLNVWSYHLFNIGIHILSGFALFGIVRRTLLTHKLKPQFGTSSVLLALISSLFWVIHPLQTMSVT